jgi:hypothetical protein
VRLIACDEEHAGVESHGMQWWWGPLPDFLASAATQVCAACNCSRLLYVHFAPCCVVVVLLLIFILIILTLSVNTCHPQRTEATPSRAV